MFRQRSHVRELTFKTGKVTFGENMPGVECAILNVSEGGACILVPEEAEIPAKFRLVIDGEIRIRLCCVRWRNRTRIGLSFEDRTLEGRVLLSESQSRSEPTEMVDAEQ